MLWNFIVDFINFIIAGFADILNVIISILPDSPFKIISNSEVSQYLGYLNWVIPLETFVSITMAWVTAIAIYYGVSIVLRWIKAIE